MENKCACESGLLVRRVSRVDDASAVPAVFASSGVEYHSIGCVNWPSQFPYCPDVRFAVAHCGECLYIHYKVREQGVLAACACDREHVWEDSCVEFFCAPGDDDTYINLEANCTGCLYSCIGKDRNSREFIPDSAYASIRRWSSLGGPINPELKRETEWELALAVPAAVYGFDDFAGRRVRGNFYKCGDNLSVPHFVSWAPIDLPAPDFHRPDFFAPIRFE
ncbi:MAG: hypothetical protein HUK01_05880 [Bacteroidaceae bacterium]|nr:hypothetical protein [Bacteroidaceae bacterium]